MIPLWKFPIKLPVELPVELPTAYSIAQHSIAQHSIKGPYQSEFFPDFSEMFGSRSDS